MLPGSNRSLASRLAYYTNPVFGERSGNEAGFSYRYRGILCDGDAAVPSGWISFIYSPGSQGACQALVLHLSDILCRIEHFGFASLVVGCAFDSAHACLAYYHSAEVHRSSGDGVHRWFPHCIGDGCDQDLVEVVLLSRKRDAEGGYGADRLYAARAVVLALRTAEW